MFKWFVPVNESLFFPKWLFEGFLYSLSKWGNKWKSAVLHSTFGNFMNDLQNPLQIWTLFVNVC